jgi:hypothetical protein
LTEIKLTSEQILTLKRHAKDYKEWLDSDKGEADKQDHIEHEQYFKEDLSRENLSRMTEDEFNQTWLGVMHPFFTMNTLGIL